MWTLGIEDVLQNTSLGSVDLTILDTYRCRRNFYKMCVLLSSVTCNWCWMCNNCTSCLLCRQVRASRSPNQRPAPRIRTRYYYYHYRLSYLPLSATIDYYRYRLLLLPLPLLLPIVLRLLLNETNEPRVSYSRRDLARRGTWSSLFFIVPSILPFACVIIVSPWVL